MLSKRSDYSVTAKGYNTEPSISKNLLSY